MDTYNKTRVEVTKPISSILLFPDFSQVSNTGCLLNTMFIFNRSHYSLAALTSVKYDSDWNYLIGLVQNQIW